MRSLRVRLVLAHTAAFAAAMVLLALGAWNLLGAVRYADLDNLVEERDAALRSFLRIEDDRVLWTHDPTDDRQTSFLYRASRFYQIYNSRGVVLEYSLEAQPDFLPLTDAARQTLASRQRSWETLTAPGGFRVRVINSVLLSGESSYLLRTGASLEIVDRAQREFATLMASVVPLVILLGGLAGWWVTGQALARVNQIARAAERITASDLSHRLPRGPSRDEIDALSETLNRMIARLEGSFEQLRQFSVNLSHELRTPLAALRAECEVALRTTSSESEYREALQSNIQELDRMTKTISDLLALAQAEAGQVPLTRAPDDLLRIARDAVEVARPLAVQCGVALSVGQPSTPVSSPQPAASSSPLDSATLIAHVDSDQILRLLLALLDNAIKFNRPGGRVEVLVSRSPVPPASGPHPSATASQWSGEWTVIAIRDTGSGIAPEDLPHVFDRFYRASPDTAAGSHGLGIGLSLARWIAQAHGGQIEVESQPGAGSTFRVWLPLTAGEAPRPSPRERATAGIHGGQPQRESRVNSHKSPTTSH